MTLATLAEQVRDVNPETGIDVVSVPFNIYFLRTCVWVLCLLPSATLICLLRLSLLPLLLFLEYHLAYKGLPRDADCGGALPWVQRLVLYLETWSQ